ncbi:hypothetical protein CBA19CS42_40860 [Caballeronia novacaledonica]|uniref:Uncharacterized protein n=1 Tax=Caballeronia novacaledonica TaxID=1544861 RepID=A0AA37IR22_9BURK|nr:hypothetical protein CBA19CS42_40860 [Caballeronia novacaledonica]
MHQVLRQLLLRNIHGTKPPTLSLEIVASKRQSACLVERSNEAVILLDLAQSMVLKRLFDSVVAVGTDQPYKEAAEIIAAAAGLAIADESPTLFEALLSLKVPYKGHYSHEEPELIVHYGALKAILPTILVDWTSSLVDGYILAHEAAHYMVRRPDPFMSGLKSCANNAFTFALDQVCYDRDPDFEAIATYGGKIRFKPGALDRMRQDLADRRIRFEAIKGAIVEEIVCDAYALVQLANSHASVWHADSDDVNVWLKGYLCIARSYYLIMALADLHHAMIKRVRLSIVSGIEPEPADVADMHFRKITILYSIADIAWTCLPDSLRQPDAFPGLLHWVAEQVGMQKRAIDALVVMPAARVIYDALREFEAMTTNRDSISDQVPRWRGRLEVLFGRGWPAASFNADTLRSLGG